MVHFNQRLGNGKPQSHAPELPRNIRVTLLESIKDSRQNIGADPNARIAYLYPHAISVDLGGVYVNVSALGRELRGVPKKVPKHLLQSSWVRVHIEARFGQMALQMNCLFQDEWTACGADVTYCFVHVNWCNVQRQLSRDHTAQVQKVVYQLCLQFHVSPNHRNVVAKQGWKFGI